MELGGSHRREPGVRIKVSEAVKIVSSLFGMFPGRSLRIFSSIGHFMVVLGASMCLHPKLIIIGTYYMDIG